MPRNKYPEQTVEKILDAAAALFAEKGYQSTTLQDIIDATGLSKGAVYHHFRSKEEIARKVGDRMGDEMWEPLRRIREAAGLTGLQKLQAVFAMSFAGDRQQRMGRTLPHLTDDPYFLALEWQSIEERLVPEDAATDVVRLPAADRRKRGLVVSITADDFAVGDTVPYLTNRGVKGYFEALKTPVVVKETEGKKAFHFDGSQLFRSRFSLPATLQDNAPYALEAWVLNESIAENECVADFTTSHDELEKIMLVNGTEPRCGVINHYGWYEDAGYKGMKELTGRWQHIYICFDGRMGQVYINGEQVSGKDIQLLVKPSQFVTLGRNAEGEWPFTGYLHSLKLWDEYIPLQGRK